MNDVTTYATIAEAEKAITDAGYVRNAQQHIWIHRDNGKKCKVVARTNPYVSGVTPTTDKIISSFYVQAA